MYLLSVKKCTSGAWMREMNVSVPLLERLVRAVALDLSCHPRTIHYLW
jgi:hypothetical protein